MAPWYTYVTKKMNQWNQLHTSSPISSTGTENKSRRDAKKSSKRCYLKMWKIEKHETRLYKMPTDELTFWKELYDYSERSGKQDGREGLEQGYSTTVLGRTDHVDNRRRQ